MYTIYYSMPAPEVWDLCVDPGCVHESQRDEIL